MLISSVSGNGFTTLDSLFVDVCTYLSSLGFTQIYKSDSKIVLESATPVDPLADTQPWRICFDSAYSLEFKKKVIVGSDVKFETILENGRVVVGTSSNILNDGTCLNSTVKTYLKDVITFEILEHPKNGVISGVLPDFTYTPNVDYVGNDSFTFTARYPGIVVTPVTIGLNITS